MYPFIYGYNLDQTYIKRHDETIEICFKDNHVCCTITVIRVKLIYTFLYECELCGFDHRYETSRYNASRAPIITI